MQQSELKYSQPELCGQNNTASRTGSVDSSLMCDKVQQYQRLLELGFQSLLQTQSVNQIRVIDFHTNQKKQISQPKSIMLQCVEYEKEQPALAYNQYTKSMNKSQKNKALNLSKKQKQQAYQSEQQTQSLRKSCSSSKTKTASIFKGKYDYQRQEQLNFLKISQTKSQVVRKCDQFSDRFTDNFVNNQQFDLGQLSNGNFSLGFSCGFSNKPIGMNVQALQKAQKLFQFDQQVFKDKSQAVKKAQLLLNQNINHGKKQTKQQEFGSGMQEYLQQQKQGKKQGFHVQKFEISLSKQPIDNLIPTFSFAGGNKQISLNKKLQQKARRLLCINDEDEDEQGRQIQKDMKFLTNKKKKQQLTNLLHKNQKQTKKNLYQSINQPSLKNNYNLAPPNLQKKVHEQLVSESLPTVNNLAKLKSSKNLPTILNEGLKKHAYQNKQSKSKLKRKQIRSWQIVKSQIQLLIWQLKRPLESQKYIKTIKLNDLKNAAIDFEFYESENYKQFRHFTNSCKAYDCFYCELYVKEDRITKQEIIQRVIEKTSTKYFRIPSNILNKFYQQICFKLYKYQIYQNYVDRAGKIVNKCLNPSNITRQLYKKAQVHIRQNNYRGYLDCCVKAQKARSKIPGREIRFSNAICAFFLKLSDGWSTVWSCLMQKNNILYKYATQGRMKVGMKIQIACWTVLIFKNILNQFLDEQGLQRQQEAECVQFFYNNSRILDWNQKLGRPMKKDMTFYRPLNKCKPREGTIPFVQGVVIRIIANKKILNQQKRQSVYEHFLELLAQNNLTFFMRFQLPPEVYLYQSFRLNYLYQFTQIIYPQTEYLLFTQHKSTSVEIKKQKNLQKINQVFLSRFLKNNSQLPNLRAKNYKLTSQLDNCFDFVATDGKFQHDKEGIINVQPIKQGKLFYQHYKLTIRYNKYYLVKTKFSNIKTKIPNIYCHQFKA